MDKLPLKCFKKKDQNSQKVREERKKWKGNKKQVYPSLGELRKELKEPGEDSESEQDICEDEDLTEDEEGEIIELMEKHSLRVSEKQCPKMATVKQGHCPIAPPPYCSKEEVGASGCSTFCPEVWCTVCTEFWIARPLTYPVFTDDNQQRYHEPIDFKIVKALAELVRTYGVTAAFTIAQNLCIRLLNVSGTRDEKAPSLKNLSIHKTLNNLTVPVSPVCLKAPFFFMLSNATDAIKEVISCNSTDVSCIASQYWNGSANTAVVMRIPMYVPIPVKADTGTFPITEIVRTKRDFGITAALVTAITLSAAAAATAAIAMVAQVQSVETVNNIVEKTATTLTTLRSIDGHLKAGILTVNQKWTCCRNSMFNPMLSKNFQMIQDKWIIVHNLLPSLPLTD
ncbi:Retrovirus capsid, core containing protein [Cricetulus griseus]|nr:Retrovirus capsid, core containing protein [Cricetulus griseus]